jgi:hypothetical protein
MPQHGNSDLGCGAVRQVSISGQLPEDGQVGPKHVTTDAIFLNKREIVNKVLDCIRDGNECASDT